MTCFGGEERKITILEESLGCEVNRVRQKGKAEAKKAADMNKS